MKAWILGVGDEVLSGKVVNTNASYLALKLQELGIYTDEMIVVSDNVDHIKKRISSFMESDCDLLITTGGLGPTHDDLTTEGVSHALGLELEFNDFAYQNIQNYFKNENFNNCNLKQAYIPKSATVIPNSVGTACGYRVEINNKIIIVLVGPPFELKPMFESYCVPYLKSQTKNEMLVANYQVMGVGESEIEPTILELISNNPDVSINPYFSVGLIRFQIMSKSNNYDSFIKACCEFEEKLSNNIISKEGKSIEEQLVQRLKELGYRISFCESCTGGLLAATIINVSGASSVIKESLVTYSNESKIKYLKVNPQTIEQYDVASLEVAKEMSEGLYKLTKSEVCISVTGVAGPTTDNPLKPVGSVYFGLTINGNTLTFEKLFKGSRDLIRKRAVMWILYIAYVNLK